MVRLAADGPTTLAAFKERLHPVRPISPEKLSRLLKELDSDEFAVREAANRELEKLGDVVATTVRQTLARPGLSLEMRRRWKRLLHPSTKSPASVCVSCAALEVLEMVGTAEARELLRTLAGGAPEALTTIAAQAAVKRAEPRP